MLGFLLGEQFLCFGLQLLGMWRIVAYEWCLVYVRTKHIITYAWFNANLIKHRKTDTYIFVAHRILTELDRHGMLARRFALIVHFAIAGVIVVVD